VENDNNKNISCLKLQGHTSKRDHSHTKTLEPFFLKDVWAAKARFEFYEFKLTRSWMYSAQNLAALFLDKISLESCVLVSVMDDNMIFILPEQ